MRRKQGWGRLLLAICASAILSLAVASPASAYLRDFYSSFVDSPLDSDSPKTLTFNNCPRQFSSSQVQLGRGGFLGSGTNLGLTRVTNGLGDRGLTGAAELKPDDRKWHLNAQLLCATNTGDPPAGSSAAGAYLKGVYIRRSESARNSDSTKEHRARCFGRDVAIGGGYRIVRPPLGRSRARSPGASRSIGAGARTGSERRRTSPGQPTFPGRCRRTRSAPTSPTPSTPGRTPTSSARPPTPLSGARRVSRRRRRPAHRVTSSSGAGPKRSETAR